MRIKFNKDPLADKKRNYAVKTVNAYFVYAIYKLLNISLSNFKLKNACLMRLI